MKVALIHDWLNGMRGGEKVLEALCDLFPDAVIFTLFYEPDKISRKISRHEVRASALDKIPGIRKSYRNLLLLYPKAMESFKLDDFDLCISISHSVAKGIRPGPNSLHICICLTPMRYIWDRFDDYFSKQESGQIKRHVARMLCMSLRRWDMQASSRVDLFVAISEFVQRRIWKFYQRPSTVIYPFADTDFYTPEKEGIGQINVFSPREPGYFLAVSAFVPYKRLTDIVGAFKEINQRVVIVGDGPEKKKLMQMATPNVEFTGWVSDDQLLSLYRNCKALIFSGVEDFGIVPVEAQACGKPVIALAEGGALETVAGPIIGIDSVENVLASGVFFRRQGTQSMIEAIDAFERMKFDARFIRKNAMRFSRNVFQKNMLELVKDTYQQFKMYGKVGIEDKITQKPEMAFWKEMVK